MSEESPIPIIELRKLRELEEEVALYRDDLQTTRVRTLGVVRDLLRGGKPQLIVQVVTKQSAGYSLKGTWRKRADTPQETKEFMAIPFGPEAIREEITRDQLVAIEDKLANFVSESLSEMTEPLQAALAVWFRTREAVVR